MKQKRIKRRNRLHDHPLLRKCGVHEKSNKSKRSQAKQALRKSWFSLSTLQSALREKQDLVNLSRVSFQPGKVSRP